MGTHTTTAGKVKVGLALSPDCYELLKQLAPGRRALGALLDNLICAEAARRENAVPRETPSTENAPDSALDAEASAAITDPLAIFDATGQPLRASTEAEIRRVAAQRGIRQLHERAERELAERERAEKQLERQGERLRILHMLDRAILAGQAPGSIAAAACAGLLRITNAIRVNVTLWQPGGEGLEVLATAGLGHPLLKAGDRMQVGRQPWLTAARRGQTTFEDDLAQERDLPPEAEAALAQGIRSLAVIPLMASGEPIGFLAVARSVPGRLPDEELALSQQIADSLAVGINNARLQEAEQQARQRLETLQAANTALTQSLDLDAVLESLLDYLSEMIPYDSANVMLRTGEATITVWAARGYAAWTDMAVTGTVAFDVDTNPLFNEVFTSQQSLLVPDTAQCPSWERVPGAEHVLSWLAVPLLVGGRVVGVFSVDKAQAGFFNQEHVRLAEALAPQAAVAIQNARLYAEVKTGREQLQALSRRLVELQEQERRALSRDLHDTSGQTITALKLGLGSLKREAGGPEALPARVDELLQMADKIAEDLHRLAVNLRPASLDRYGLAPALEQLLTEFRKQTGLRVEFDAQGVTRAGGRLPSDVETALYRIVQEALTNVTRYAHANIVSVLFQKGSDWAQVIVEDDGRGFDLASALGSGRLGLLGMRERAEMLGGTLEIETRPEHGTTIYATIPISEADTESGTPERTENGQPETPAPAPTVVEEDARLAEAAELARGKTLSDGLIEITAAMGHCSSADEILRLVLARSAELLGRDNAHIAMREGDGWAVRYGYREGFKARHLKDPDAPALCWVERTRQVLVVNDTRDSDLDDGLRLTGLGIKSYASLPLPAGDRLLGVLSFVDYGVPTTFHPSEVDFLNRLATLVALALENAQLHAIETRQRDEMALRVEELEALLALLPAGVGIAYDPEATDIRVNPALAQMVGMAPDANISLSAGEPERPHYRVFDRGGRELPPDELPIQVAARGVAVRDMVLDVLREDGSMKTLLSNAVPLRTADGDVRGAVAAFVDITERRRAEE